MIRNVLVTGGCGFIGSNFLNLFVPGCPDWNFINVDKLTYAGNPANLEDLEGSPRYEFVHGDICDRDLLDRLRHEVHERTGADDVELERLARVRPRTLVMILAGAGPPTGERF